MHEKYLSNKRTTVKYKKKPKKDRRESRSHQFRSQSKKYIIKNIRFDHKIPKKGTIHTIIIGERK